MKRVLIGVTNCLVLIGNKDTNIVEDTDFDDEEFDSMWFDYCLYYDNAKKCYNFEFETFFGWDSPDGAVDWVKYLLDITEDYCERNNIDTTRLLNLYEVFTLGYNANIDFCSAEDAVAWLKFAVDGFQGLGLYCLDAD